MNSEVNTLLKDKNATIVDVRTYGEFMGGHVSGSINIPLNELPGKVGILKTMGPIVLCCASGGRSMQAAMFLRQQGVECADGGSWLNVNYLKNN